jgi:alpha-glucosidase
MSFIKAASIFLFVMLFAQQPYNSNLYAKVVELSSPNGKIHVEIKLNNKIYYSIFFNSKEILKPSPISLTVNEGLILGKNPRLTHFENSNIDEKIYPVVPEKRKVIKNQCNESFLNFEGKYGLVFRAYNDGVAYRFVTKFKEDLKVISEEAGFNLAKDDSMYIPFEESFLTHSERLYSYLPVSEVTTDKMCSLPVLVYSKEGPRIAITEADLDDYPGMYLQGSDDGTPGLTAIFPAYPLKEKKTNDRTVKVTERADYIAITKGDRSYPWRVIVIAENDGDLIETDIVYRLAKPLQLKDTSWIRPGKVAWDWWNANNIYGVDFKAGINTETYKYYIDFAAENNIEYIIMDEGWSDPSDLFKINPELNMDELLQYSDQKNVGIILWCVWITLDKQLQPALDLFEKWGIKGIKVDFMQRDDQKLVNYYYKIARETAKRHLLVDFHGSYKPTGLRRAYPNVLTREGVQGLEQSKWCDNVNPEHDLTIPFIRMLAGPMDYTPGAMNNAQKRSFRPDFYKPMSQGTRVHQLAMYVIFESPLQMLADSPSNYEREPEIMEYLSKVPTVWDETIVLNARVSDYVIVARKSKNEWYIGAMSDWTPRTLQINLSFLEEGEYVAEIYSDGANASGYASDFKKTIQRVTQKEKLDINLAPGGGWVARIYKF